MAVKDVELPLAQAAPTLHLYRKMRADYPEFDFAFVIGTDLVSTLEGWGCGAVPEWGLEAIPTEIAGPALFKEAHFIVINRPGYIVPEE
jgi:nicotinic acid mononucleotide adenylyltransferase